MAEAKKKQDEEAVIGSEPQKVADAEQEQGFVGDKVDPLPNEAHSLESGPEAPTAAEQAAALAKKDGE